MSLIQAILLGIVQGLTEFLPVSSSGHLAIVENLFNIDTGADILFDVLLHIGTLAAVCFAYSRDIRRLIIETIRIIMDIVKNIQILIQNLRSDAGLRYKKIVHNNYRKFVVLVIFSTIPTGIIGYTGKALITAASKTLLVPGICLLVTATLLLITDFVESGDKLPRDVSYTNGLLIGIAQGFATFPGISRSGTTIAACLFSGFDRRFAVKYSFIMSIPAIVGAALLEIKDIEAAAISAPLVGKYMLGMLISGVVGYYCIRKMLVIVKKKKFKYFSYYCYAMGAFSIIMHFVR